MKKAPEPCSLALAQEVRGTERFRLIGQTVRFRGTDHQICYTRWGIDGLEVKLTADGPYFDAALVELPKWRPLGNAARGRFMVEVDPPIQGNRLGFVTLSDIPTPNADSSPKGAA